MSSISPASCPPDVPFWVRMTETVGSLAASRTLHEAVL